MATDAEFINKFSSEYYNWLCNCIILPHFGLSKQIKPIAISIAQSILDTFNPMPEIIEKLALDIKYDNILNKITVNIFYDYNNIGYIHLSKDNLSIDKLSNFIIITLNYLELQIEYRKKKYCITCIIYTNGNIGCILFTSFNIITIFNS
jgi:hypothetical protein